MEMFVKIVIVAISVACYPVLVQLFTKRKCTKFEIGAMSLFLLVQVFAKYALYYLIGFYGIISLIGHIVTKNKNNYLYILYFIALVFASLGIIYKW